MCWIDSQSKKLIHLKYLIIETSIVIRTEDLSVLMTMKHLIPFSLYSVGILVLQALDTLSRAYSRK